MSKLLKDIKFFDRDQVASTTVVFNGESKLHDAFFRIEITLKQALRIFSIDQESNSTNALIVRAEIEQELLEKVKALNTEKVEVINSKLNDLPNPAKIINFTPTYIEIEFANNNEVDLTSPLDILLENS